VGSVYRIFSLGSRPLGIACTGLLLQTIHTVPTVLALFGVMLALALLNTFNRSLRQAEFIANNTPKALIR